MHITMNLFTGRKIKKTISTCILFFFTFIQVLPFLPATVQNAPLIKTIKNARLSFFEPQVLDASGLSSASATLSNPRLSYEAGLGASPIAAGNTVIVITNSGNADNDTTHLFPKDTVSVGPNLGLKVTSVADSVTFVVDTGLGTGVTSADKVYSIQSGTLTTSFYTGSAIPIGGSISVSIPAATGAISGGPNDNYPDTAALASNGFDLNSITNSDTTCPSGFSVGTLTAGTGGPSNPHIITCNWGGAAALPSGANLSVTIGTPAKGLINPAPATSHVQGVSDSYGISLNTKSIANGGGTTLESIVTKVAPVEGVLVSATVDETLNFTVAAVTSGNITATCGFTPSGTLMSSTATAVPFGNNLLANTFYNAAQQLTVSTNAPSGYTVKVEENDQMGKEGKICTGAAAAEVDNCIKDTTCNGGACTESTSADWFTNTNNGLGYSLSDVSGANASFLYNESGRAFSTKQFADMEATETKQTIMSSATVVSGSSACIVYRLSVSGTQPAGYYFNKIKYTASATF